jgi:hypothetical protein
VDGGKNVMGGVGVEVGENGGTRKQIRQRKPQKWTLLWDDDGNKQSRRPNGQKTVGG